MRKLFMTLMAVAAIAMCFTSCKKNNNEPEQPGGEQSGSNDYQIRVYFNENQLDYMDITVAYTNLKGESRHFQLEKAKGESLNMNYMMDKTVSDLAKTQTATIATNLKAMVISEKDAKGWQTDVRITCTPKADALYNSNDSIVLVDGLGSNRSIMETDIAVAGAMTVPLTEKDIKVWCDFNSKSFPVKFNK